MRFETPQLFGLQLIQLLALIEGDVDSDSDFHDAILKFNVQYKTEINVFLNLNQGENANERPRFENAVFALNHLPKVISTDMRHIMPLQRMFTEQSLTLAWMTWQQLNATIAAIDRLLWQLHFKDIILVYQQSHYLHKELDTIFEMCWRHGFTSVLVWLTNPQTLYTYQPYPSLRVKRLSNISEFGDKRHLNNFHLYNWPQPALNAPPRFGIYTNRQGRQIYWGYLQKIISVFLTHHNGTITYYFVDLSGNATEAQLLLYIQKHGYNFVPAMGYYIPQLSGSIPLYLTRGVMMVPTAPEISERLYLLIAFDTLMWFLLIFTGLLLFLLLIALVLRETKSLNVSKAALIAFCIIVFVAVPIHARKSKLNFVLNVLFLFTGFFLTNYYSTSLSSLYTSKVYEPQLKCLSDVKHTNLRIFEHSLDVAHFDQSQTLPSFLRQRFHVGNNTQYYSYRQNLNMTYIYTGLEDIIDYFLSQQRYLKKPIAKKLEEPLLLRPHYVRMAHRSPLLEQFNRYLTHIMDTGLYNKFVEDAKWEGIHSGNLRMLRDPEGAEALKFEYFHYAFIMLLIGLFGALMTFVMETIWKRVEPIAMGWVSRRK